MNMFKVGVIGCGGIANHAHVPTLTAMPNVQICALCDIVEEKAKDMKGRFNLQDCAIYTDYRALLQDSAVEAVHICTPNVLHAEIAIAALKAGKHVFCEKPDAILPTLANQMAHAQRESGKVLMCMRNNRHIAVTKFLKKWIDDGRAGEIYMGRCGWIRRRGIPGKGGWFTTKSLSGGGPLIDLGVHMIDLAIYLMGNKKPVAVTGYTTCKFADNSVRSDSVHSMFGEAKADAVFDVEDFAAGMIRFENGACLQIEFSWASNIEREKNFIELRGSKSGITWENGRGKIFGEEYGELYDMELKIPDTNGHAENIRHFYEVLSGNAKPDYTIEQGIEIIKILEAVYRSAETGREVIL